MQVLYFSSLYSGYKLYERDAASIEAFIKAPMTNVHCRENVPLWAFYRPIAEPSLAKDGLPSGCADNMRDVTALQIDYDGGTTIDDFIQQFADTRFLLYTSYRSTPALNKFRVIFPLAESFANALLKSPRNKQLLEAMFVGCDTSTVNSFRKQRVPALDPMHPEFYRYHINSGNFLTVPIQQMIFNRMSDLKRLEERVSYDDSVELPDRYYSIQGLYVPRPSNGAKKIVDEVIDELNSLPYNNRGHGHVHAGLLRCWGRLIGVGIDTVKAQGIMLSNTPTSVRKEVDAIIKWK